MKIIIYDIETVPLDAAALARMEPEFEAPGNYKDPEKIAAAIAEKRAAWVERAALSPLTGRVAMTGICDGAQQTLMAMTAAVLADPKAADAYERAMLMEWWATAERAIVEGCLLAGWNSHGFDIPFLVRRSWALGVPVPHRMTGRLSLPWVDLMLVFTCGAYGEYVSLDKASKFLGVGFKTGDGADVARLLREDPAAAEAYLYNDLTLTRGIALKLGLESWGPSAPATPAKY